MSEIAVTIPTFRRPEGLKRLLLALEKLESRSSVRIVVADNDAEEREGLKLCQALSASGYRWPIEASVVAERGISQARNALAALALADARTQYVVMVDDDEWPEPQWLDALLKVRDETGAEVVRGTVLRDFETPPPRWALHWEGIAPIRQPTGYDGMIEGIGNVLIARRCFELIDQPYFDSFFGLTGGEDKDFFLRLRAKGIRFSRAEDAIVHEHVPASRIGLRWSLQRAYRVGNSDMHLAFKHANSRWSLAREMAKIAAALLSVPVLLIWRAFSPEHRLDGLRKLYRAMGKIGAVLGHRYHEYAVSHGR